MSSLACSNHSLRSWLGPEHCVTEPRPKEAVLTLCLRQATRNARRALLEPIHHVQHGQPLIGGVGVGLAVRSNSHSTQSNAGAVAGCDLNV